LLIQPQPGCKLAAATHEITRNSWAVRHDSLLRRLDRERWSSDLSPFPADELWRSGRPPVSGEEVANTYGLLAHYTTLDALEWIRQMDAISPRCWLTPTTYAACMSPYDLGLNTPRDVCLLVDVRSVPQLWGPGTSRPSSHFPMIWAGGAIEFFSDSPISFSNVRRAIRIEPCGDMHR
jgi:hypothetical protein